MLPGPTCKFNSIHRKAQGTKVEFGLVVGFSTIFKEPLLAALDGNFYNFHAGKLPQYRGGSPLNWQIIHGKNSIGVSILRLGSGIDDGPIVSEGSFGLKEKENISDAHRKANDLFAKLGVELIENIKNVGLENLKEVVQDDDQACYWHQRSNEDSKLGSTGWFVNDVINLTRAINKPYGGVLHSMKGKSLRIFEVERCNQKISGRVERPFISWAS